MTTSCTSAQTRLRLSNNTMLQKFCNSWSIHLNIITHHLTTALVVTAIADERRSMWVSCVIRVTTSARYGGIFDRVVSCRLNWTVIVANWASVHVGPWNLVLHCSFASGWSFSTMCMQWKANNSQVHWNFIKMHIDSFTHRPTSLR